MSGFLSVEEVANLLGSMRNPPKPLSLQAVQKSCKNGKYTTRQVPAKSGKSGVKYEIAITSLTKEAQEKRKKQHAQHALAQLNEQAKLEDIPQAETALIDYVAQ